MRRLASTLGALALAAWLGGCATVEAPKDGCAQWFAQLDAAVDAAGVRDAQDERVRGFEFLRVDRLAAATRDSTPLPQWLERTAALDAQARDAELANLPPSTFPIDSAADAAAARERSKRCRGELSQRVRQDAALQRTLIDRATVPDRYSTALRAAGAYPLLRWPFFAGVQAWQDEHSAAVAQWTTQPPPRVRFEPPADDPQAPVFEIELRDKTALAPFDHFGAPFWPAPDAAAPQIDSARPVVYRREAQTLFGGRTLRQLVYTLWFPERPLAGRFDLLGGALDGVIVRLTYDSDGTPLMLDTIHACGCYHLFFPAAGLRLRGGAPRAEEWAFVPAPLPALRPGERVVVRIASATHYVTAVVRDDDGARNAGTGYTLRNENELRSLPLPGGGARSLYGPDGLVRGTERGERFLFWPMGIASAGAMRQWGHHATAFVGRRHFDDPNLLESRFVLPAVGFAPP